MYYSTSRIKRARRKVQTVLNRPIGQAAYKGKIYPSGHITVGRVPAKKSDCKVINDSPENIYEVAELRTLTVSADRQDLEVTATEKYFRTKEEKIPTPPLPPPDDLKEIMRRGQSQAQRPRQGLTLTPEYDSAANPSSRGGGDLRSEAAASGSFDLTSLPSPHKRGRRGLTRRGSILIREYAFLASQDKTRKYAMYTLTCPYTEIADVHAYSRNIAEINRRYFQEVTRLYARRGQEFHYVGVLEVQEGRYEKYGCVALHVHYLAPCTYKGSSNYVCTFSELKEIYRRVLRSVVRKEVSCAGAIDGSVVKKSCSRYMSKYMSKNKNIISTVDKIDESLIPSRWYVNSRNAATWVDSYTVSISGDTAYEIMEYLNSIKDDRHLCKFYKELYIEVSSLGAMRIGIACEVIRNVADSLTEFVRTSRVDSV